MKTLGMILCAGLLSLNSFAQDSRLFTFQGTVTDKTDQKVIEGFLVDIYEGNQIIQSPKAGKKGRFEADLFGGSEYTMDISLEGYYPKRIVVITNVPEDVKKVPDFKFEIELIRKSDYEALEKIDIFSTSIFDFPYVIFEWDTSLEDFTYREAYTEHIKEKYAEVSDLR